MDIVNKVMVWLGDASFALLSWFSPLVGLWIISAITGVLMLYIWRYTSNQDAIADVRRKISAHLLATRLFKDDLSVSFRAQRQIVWQAIRLLGHSIRPMLIMTIPFVLIMIQIGLRYEFRPAVVGEPVRVKASLKSAEKLFGLADQLKAPSEVKANRNDPCRVAQLGTVDWRLTPQRAGTYELVFGSGEDTVEMPLEVGDDFRRVSKLRGGGFLDRLLYSGEPSIPESSVFESIEVYYPARSTLIFGLDIHWLISLLVLSIVFALIFKPVLKVHI